MVCRFGLSGWHALAYSCRVCYRLDEIKLFQLLAFSSLDGVHGVLGSESATINLLRQNTKEAASLSVAFF